MLKPILSGITEKWHEIPCGLRKFIASEILFSIIIKVTEQKKK